MKDTFTGSLDGNLNLKIDLLQYNRSILEKYLNKELTITVDEKKKPRSASQNAWYWGVAIPTIIAGVKEYEGKEFTKDDIHEFILTEIVRTEGKVMRILGRPIVSYGNKTTSNMNVKEFNQFKEELQEYFAIRDIQIPDPNE